MPNVDRSSKSKKLSSESSIETLEKCNTTNSEPDVAQLNTIRRSSRIKNLNEALANETVQRKGIKDDTNVTTYHLLPLKGYKVSSIKCEEKKTHYTTKDDIIHKKKFPNIDNTENEAQPSTSKFKHKDEVETRDADHCKDSELSPQDTEMDQENVNDDPENIFNKKCVNLYAPDTGPQMYNVKGSVVTRPIITKNLPKVFQFLPVHGKPECTGKLQEFYRSKVKDYVGCGLNDNEFEDLENYCSPEFLKTGKEIKMETSVPVMGLLNNNTLQESSDTQDMVEALNLYIHKKHKMKLDDKDIKTNMTKKLKYRGIRILPCNSVESPATSASSSPTEDGPDEELEPGTDILYRVRIYRPYSYSLAKERYTRGRHGVFSCEVVVAGRQRLCALRDRFVCHNDFDLRVDASDHPDMLPAAVAKEVFPSGFLFINNVFYVDKRDGCLDYSEPIRAWAWARGLGRFPVRDMARVTLDQLVLKLGYPEVYVHQGNCEHVFLFSEVRLLNANDPLRLRQYPYCASVAQNQTVYCTTCAEFSAKWIVVGSHRVPFDPGFFCDTCFKQYMYKDSQKIGDFKAFRYRGNALNVLKPYS